MSVQKPIECLCKHGMWPPFFDIQDPKTHNSDKFWSLRLYNFSIRLCFSLRSPLFLRPLSILLGHPILLWLEYDIQRVQALLDHLRRTNYIIFHTYYHLTDRCCNSTKPAVRYHSPNSTPLRFWLLVSDPHFER